MSTTNMNMNITCFIIILASTSFFSMATAEDGYIFKSDAATATSEKSLTGGTNKTIDSNISIGLLCALTLIAIVLIICVCVTILLIKFRHGIIFLLCFHMMMKSNDKKPIYTHNETNNTVENNGRYSAGQAAGKASGKFNITTWIMKEQPPKRKPKMSKPLSVKKETEELLQQSGAIQLLSQIYDMTKSLLNDTREVIQKFNQDEGTSKNSTECISTELAALQKQSQSLFPDNLSHAEAPGSLEGFPACLNHRNSHGSLSTNTLDSKACKQIKHDVDVPKEIAPFLKNNSLRRITYDFNEIQSPTASNTNNGSNISTGTLFSIALIIGLLFKSGNEVTTDKKTYYIHNEKNIFQNTGEFYGQLGGTQNAANVSVNKPTNAAPEPSNSKYVEPSLN